MSMKRVRLNGDAVLKTDGAYQLVKVPRESRAFLYPKKNIEVIFRNGMKFVELTFIENMKVTLVELDESLNEKRRLGKWNLEELVGGFVIDPKDPLPSCRKFGEVEIKRKKVGRRVWSPRMGRMIDLANKADVEEDRRLIRMGHGLVGVQS